MPPASPPETHRHNLPKLIVWLTAVVTFVAIVYFTAPFVELILSKPVPIKEPTDMSMFFDAIRTGDFKSALIVAGRIKNDPKVTATDKALLTLNLASQSFNTTDNKESWVADINAVKGIAVDEQVDLPVRVQAINYLAVLYISSGWNSELEKEIFKNPPFSNYLVRNDPDLSDRKFFEWSYSLKPTAIAAINISNWYAHQGMGDYPDYTPHAVPENINAAEKYLNKADALAAEEAAGVEDYTNSSGYISYRFRRTLVIGQLANQSVEPYISMWPRTFREFLKFAFDSKNPVAKNDIAMIRYFFANSFRIGKFPGYAEQQYKLLVRDMIGLTATSSFVQYVVDAHKDQNGPTWKTIVEGYKVYPPFETAVNEVISSWSK